MAVQEKNTAQRRSHRENSAGIPGVHSTFLHDDYPAV
jgi:hypothetical protein